uniref:Uncharacterized protein n=1 Tax=Medicago truncatula TaxID=3880 RepID=I3S5H4_MEDTR|nr:unknown [Medicago truncatula]
MIQFLNPLVEVLALVSFAVHRQAQICLTLDS